jgi:membrane protease YdiL (CAAX protease family)
VFADASSSSNAQVLLFSLLAWVCMIPVAGAVCIGLWWAKQPRQRVWPPQRQRFVTWTMLEFGLAYLFIQFMLPVLFIALFQPWIPEEIRTHATTPEGKVQIARLAIHVAMVAAPFQVLLLVGILRLQAKSHALQMGLSLHRWRADLVAGFMGWLFLTPLCYLIFWGIQQPFLEDAIGPLSPHLLQYLFEHGPTLWEWIVLVLVTVVAAPVVEEILIRGILQPLMVKQPLLADATVITGLLVAIGIGLYRGYYNVNALLPILFLIGAGGGYLLFEWLMQPWLPRPGAARAIFAASLVFATMHYDAWPSPIPLFFLALGLGFVSYRTQSLWGAILMHSLFNLVNFVALALVRVAA